MLCEMGPSQPSRATIQTQREEGECCEYAAYRLLFAGSYSPAVHGCPLDGEADGEAETGTVWSIYMRLVLRFLGT